VRLVACCKLRLGGLVLSAGDAFEASDHSGRKLIAQGAAKASPKKRAKKAVKAEE